MIGKEIQANRVAPLPEVLEILSKREEGGELGFEQKGALEYARKFSHVSPERAKDLVLKLIELPFVSEAMAAKTVDLLPKKEEEVMLIFAQEKRDLTSAQAKQVLEAIKSL